jgi:signal transduction histidine kinase
LLNGAAPRLAAQLNPGKLLQEVTDIATALAGAEFGAFFQSAVGEQGESYTLYTFSGVQREAFADLTMPRNTGIVRCEDVRLDDRYAAGLAHLPVRSYLAVPVVARSGEVLGSLFFGHSLPGTFTESHEAIITGIAAQAAIAMDNARLFEQAQWAQAELKRSNEELRRVNRDLEVFAYSASHDLQEPLRTIAISAQLIERNRKSQLGEDAIFLDNILTAARRMSVLLQDLLAYTTATKYEEGQAPNVDAGRVLAGVVESLRAPIEEAGAKVTAGALPAVGIHEGRLAQLFQNLIGNAIKYRNKKEVPCISVTAEQRDGWWVFSVADNGIGIEPQYAEQIFGLFKRLHGRDEYPGSGIGLSICQRVMEQYGGRIWLEKSSPAEGSTFCFALPSRS